MFIRAAAVLAARWTIVVMRSRMMTARSLDTMARKGPASRSTQLPIAAQNHPLCLSCHVCFVKSTVSSPFFRVGGVAVRSQAAREVQRCLQSQSRRPDVSEEEYQCSGEAAPVSLMSNERRQNTIYTSQDATPSLLRAILHARSFVTSCNLPEQSSKFIHCRRPADTRTALRRLLETGVTYCK